MKRTAELVLAIAILAAGCKDPLPLEGLPCPCVAGYTCDDVHHVCVRDGGECSVATEAMDCGPHEFCDVVVGAYRCACVAGYAATNEGCVWTGVVRDPGISGPSTWTEANGALLNPTAPGGIDPGEASFLPSSLCTLGHIKQTFEMPAFAKAEPLVLELSYKTSSLFGRFGYTLMGVSWDRGWVALRHPVGFADAQFHAVRLCLGESAYAPEGTTGRGAPVTLSLGPYDEPTGCPGPFPTDFAIDHAQIVPANAGECAAQFGRGVNSDAESTGGWTFSLWGGASDGFVDGIGAGGSRAVRVVSSCVEGVAMAEMTHPIDIVARNPALEMFVQTTGGVASTVAEASLGAEPFSIPLPPVGEPAVLHMCLPPSLAGQSTDLVFGVLLKGGTCTGVPDSSIVVDNVRVIDDPGCQPNDATGNPGFEQPGAVLGAGADGVLGDSAVGSAVLIRNAPGVAHSGTGYLAIESYGYCSTASLGLSPIVPKSKGAAGPALTLFSNLGANPDASTRLGANNWQVLELPKGGGWIKNTLCLNPRFTGRPQPVFIRQSGGDKINPGPGPMCDPVGYETQATLIDDIEVTTDPSCPAQ